MIEGGHRSALRKIHARLENSGVDWVVTGSLGMALQGMDLPVHDIDLQTDQPGAYEIERRLSEYVVKPVSYKPSERIHSHAGMLELDGVQVEIIGGIQKRHDDGTWEDPVQVERHRHWVEFEGLRVPVLSLEYEYEAYRLMGRNERAALIRKWLDRSASS